MEYKISIQALIFGMLKKWKIIIVAFIVVLAVIMGLNVYNAKKAADMINEESSRAASGLTVNEKTVTTANKEVLTISQLNNRIKNLREKVDYFEKLIRSPRMNADAGKVYNYVKKYYISRHGAEDKSSEQLAQGISSALNQYIKSEYFKDIVKVRAKGTIESIDLEYISDIVSVGNESVTVCIKVSYLKENDATSIMEVVDPILCEKMDEYKNTVGGYSVALMQTVGYVDSDESLMKSKENNDLSYVKAKSELDSLIPLALTVEDESKVGIISQNESPMSNIDVTTVSWTSQIGMKKTLLAVLLALFASLVIGFAWVAFVEKRVMSVYDVLDNSDCEILGVQCYSRVGLLERIQQKRFGKEAVSMSVAKIKKMLEARGGQLLIDAVGYQSIEECPNSIIAPLMEASKGMKGYTFSDDPQKLVEASNVGDICVQIVRTGSIDRNQFVKRIHDYREVGLTVTGSFVEI